MSRKLGLSRNAAAQWLRNNGLSVSKELQKEFRSKSLFGKTSFKLSEDKYIKENYLTIPVKTIGEHLGRSYTGIMGRLKAMGLEIPENIVEERKKASQIKMGNTPPNKGKKQTEFMTAEAIARTAITRFQKGNLPHNTKADHQITIRADKRGVKYKFIRIGLGKWVPLQRFNWEQVNGKIPSGFNIIFKDGNTMNCEVENLEMLSNSELMKRNSYHNYGEDIAKTIQLQGALTRQINKHLKKKSA